MLLADHRLSPARFEGIPSPFRLRIGGSTSANLRFARLPGRAVFVTALQAFGCLADDQATPGSTRLTSDLRNSRVYARIVDMRHAPSGGGYPAG